MQKEEIEILDYLKQEADNDDIKEILTGLTAEKKYISSKFFYDAQGSKLFEEITQLDEYYPTRTEKSIIHEISPKIINSEKNIDIIELGSGDCSKISILFKAATSERLKKLRYVPIDVSASSIKKSSSTLLQHFPDLKIQGLVADFMKHLNQIPQNSDKIICFFGGTIGNLPKKEAIKLLKNIRNTMRENDRFLLGIDLVKDIDVIENAYNDNKNITAAFNKNILNNVNRIINSDIDLSGFEHFAFYNKEKKRIEMHLVALNDQEVISTKLPDVIKIRKGECIHTENSHKYTIEDIFEFASLTGLKIKNIFTDKNKWFSIVEFGS
ncbi:MAG: L-histidine N(alpha)-methyltransferase [Bacteroidales bacterium]